jgi:fucose 4-O-acetylase-like acetyltransferase
MVFVCVLLVFSVCHYFFNSTINLNQRVYDGYLIPTIEALSGIYIVLSLSYIFQFANVTSRIFSYIGSLSLFVFIFHFWIQGKALDVISDHFGKVNISIALFSY